MAVLDSNASIVAKYNYDAWGKVLSVTNASGTVQTASTFIGNINPIRYRGYYYDVETGLYYLQSRYYDPETGRFVNADGSIYTTNIFGANLFVYCVDDPINNMDPTGDWCGVDDVVTGPIDEIIVFALIAFLAYIGVPGAQQLQNDLYDFLASTWNGFTAWLSKSSKSSGKERATDKPSWVNKGMIDWNLPAEENARRFLDDKYGKGNWRNGPGSEFNKIKKWLTRDIGLKSLVSEDYNEILILDGDVYIFDPTGNGFGWVNGIYYQRLC